MPPLVYRTPGAAQYLGLSPSTLEKMRLQGTGPRFTKLGSRAVGYFVEDLDAFAEFWSPPFNFGHGDTPFAHSAY